MDRTHPRTTRGFTLIEALVAMALAAILASLAWPSYREQVAKGRRVNAQAMLFGAAQYMERFYTENHRYDQDLSGKAVALPDNLRQTADGAYTLQVIAPERERYTLSATPKAAQASDRCGTLSISHTGAKQASQPDCWRR